MFIQLPSLCSALQAASGWLSPCGRLISAPDPRRHGLARWLTDFFNTLPGLQASQQAALLAYAFRYPLDTHPRSWHVPLWNVSDTPQFKSSFPVTRWSLVTRVRDGDEEERSMALGELCEAYWYPVYSFLRRKGVRAEDAEDQTQGFFAMVLRRDDFSKADAGRGRLRSFLLRALQHFGCDEHERANRLKRGGGRTIVSFDALEAEKRFAAEPSTGDGLETHYERQWALVLLERALERLKSEQKGGREEDFEVLRPLLTGAESYDAAAGALNCTPGAARVRVHRLRQRLKQLLEEEIRDTVESEEEFEEEYRQFRVALGG